MATTTPAMPSMDEPVEESASGNAKSSQSSNHSVTLHDPAASPSPDASLANAHVVHLRLLFTAWITHFRSLGYMKDTTMEMLDKTVLKKTVELTVRDGKARLAIGLSEQVWSDLVDLFHVAIPSLEGRTYVAAPAVGASTGYDANGLPYDNGVAGGGSATASLYDAGASGPSSNMMVTNSATLLKDLQRLDSILALARNVLTAGDQCQNLAAQVGFDREVCAVINLCVKITARGFDGDSTGTADEEKWNNVVNGFKKLLITSLQFLSNLVTMNERLKLMLWVELFDNASENGAGLGSLNAPTEGKGFAENWGPSTVNASINQDEAKFRGVGSLDNVNNTTDISASASQHNSAPRSTIGTPMRPVTPYFLFLQENRDKIKAELSDSGAPTTKQLVQEGTRRWNSLSDTERQVRRSIPSVNLERFERSLIQELQEVRQRYMQDFEKYKKDLDSWNGVPLDTTKEDGIQAATDTLGNVKLDAEDEAAAQIMDGVISSNSTPKLPLAPKQSATHTNPNPFTPLTQAQTDYHMIESAADGAKKLAEGKSQLLKRLESANLQALQPPPLMSPASPIQRPVSPVGEIPGVLGDEEDEEEDEEEESDEEDSSDEDDYAVPGEDGRGLLTDVPLILGPNEIEVLPMIIMSGIVAPSPEANQAKGDDATLSEGAVNMYTIRCHLLLAQENGRNLLRELLIFVAAWDLREEELYFKFMVKIMEAILMNGLMPFAYNAFKESKDIISPAQAVIMKLLTKIFHSRQAFVGGNNVLTIPPRQQSVPSTNDTTTSSSSGLTAPLRFDIQIVHFLFSEFRANIIPQICALIFLQGQIRAGYAALEDFPLNLWDMERMYEGVYQYLEFFAILTDHDSWKMLMAEWEVAYELVTLLRELEVAIPKGGLIAGPSIPEPLTVDRKGVNTTTDPTMTQQQPQRSPSISPQLSTPAPAPIPVAVERPYDITSPPPPLLSSSAPPPSSGIAPPLPPSVEPSPSKPYPEAMHDEPADFEWRNLKKLCVLVLSSLVWKNRRLQDQVRLFDGIPAILSCCAYDEHNPYIREHAIMCLRFLLEGNRENQDVVRGFADKDVVAREASEGAAKAEEAERKMSSGVSEVAAAANAEGGTAAGPASAVQVPMEVLDSRGYETYMDGKGKVGLRRKEGPHGHSDTSGPTYLEPTGQYTSIPHAASRRHEPGLSDSDLASELVNGAPAVEHAAMARDGESFLEITSDVYKAGKEGKGGGGGEQQPQQQQERWSKGLPSWMQMMVNNAKGAASGGAGMGSGSGSGDGVGK